MPIEDEDLSVVEEFSNLEKLNLNHTDVSNGVLAYLADCDRLESLSLSGTTVDLQISEKLGALESLREVYLWYTGIDNNDLIKLRERWPNISFYSGYMVDQDPLIKLTK